MVGLFYPIAASADAALADLNLQLLRCAAWESDARRVAGRDVLFKSEYVGDPFSERDPAGKRVDDLIGWGIPAAALAIVPVTEGRRRRRRPLPSPAGDTRWPVLAGMSTVRFRISMSFWCSAKPRDGAAEVRKTTKSPPRRRKVVDPLDMLRRINTPLGPSVPQLELDIGLFEIHPLDQPEITIADE